MAFLRNLLATLVGLFIFSLLGFFILVGIVASASSDEAPTVKSNSVLYFPMTGILEEKAVDDPFLTVFGDGPQIQSLLDIITAINKAKNDDRIKGIYIEPMYLAGSYAGLQEIRDAILDFKESGKFVYAYGEYISESDYYVVSVADSLFLNPTGAIEFNGLDINVTFFKGMFDKLDIKPEVFRVGDFKSYVEPYIRKDLSDENRLQYSELLSSMYNIYLSNVSNSIQIPTDKLAEISDQMKVSLPQDAVDVGLIHKIGYEDELKSVMKQKLGMEEDKELRTMKMNKYIQAIAAEGKYSTNRVAVIVAEGDIVMGGDEGIVGATYAEEIRKARNNDRVKAIVMRVNSGGGSMTASDMIWRELMLTKGKKPIIASMGGAAASGGYYIAMPADTIIAQPNTITGSIGIFGMWFNFGEFLENKIGITHDVVKTGEYSDIYTVTRQLTDAERAIIQRGVNEGYEVFTQKVADARGMTQDDVKKIASGRVWSGEQAVGNGLVDQLGSFNDAINLAVEAAGIGDDYSVSYYPKEKPFIEEFLEKMNAKVQFTLFGMDADPAVKAVKELNQHKGLQARVPGNIEVR
ncbi:protease-4 [Ekhidna lutea]|uniref:Protease-4 n=1 Tax=Ekhidna lutea TaxID=447679 RepID=A0A239M0Z5_EKHLU|nr:signal peptide peptidase SppA [Ekhidna lutea]SNT35962.1 protease-4 [Ekhidna lutea]